MEEPDPKVVRAAAAGDVTAFADLVRTSQAHVWRFARHLLGDDDLAADVTQETFVRVHRHLAHFRYEARFSTWLLRIARNAAVDEQRRRAQRQRLTEALPSPRLAPDASLGTEVRTAMASLPPSLREAFVLVEVFGQRYQDAAAVLGVPVGTVKSRVHRARVELVRWFAADDSREGHGA